MFESSVPPTSGEVCLVDTSAALALLVSDHEHHDATFEALGERRLGLCGHAAFETFSVLTRLPVPNRRAPSVVARLLASNFPETRFLTSPRAVALVRSLGEHGLGGGAVYDALVGATAVEHGLVLVSWDRRALDTYHRLGVEVELLT